MHAYERRLNRGTLRQRETQVHAYTLHEGGHPGRPEKPLGTEAALNASHGFVRYKDLVGPQQISHIQLLLLFEPDVRDVSDGQVQRVLHVEPIRVVHHDEHLGPRPGLLEGLDHGFGILGADLRDGGIQPIDDGHDAGTVLDQAGNGKPPLLLVDVLLVVPVVPRPKGHTTTPEQGGPAGPTPCVTSALLGVGLLSPSAHLGACLGVRIGLASVGQLGDQLLVDKALAVHTSRLQVQHLLPSRRTGAVHNADGSRTSRGWHLSNDLGHPPCAGLQRGLNLGLVGSDFSLDVRDPAPIGEKQSCSGGADGAQSPAGGSATRGLRSGERLVEGVLHLLVGWQVILRHITHGGMERGSKGPCDGSGGADTGGDLGNGS
mmetsp:Transcript_46677/g.83533  ORF Transcript_46677/g.83533 Transcript_46677/m.83533 type:complete len:375 (-) Transcript_46677:156-1280(-)